MKSKAFQFVTVCALVIAGVCAVLSCAGCAYRGGKVVDGTNLAIGMTIPGTEWSINALDYVGGVRVAGQDSTKITVTNDVDETNSYFGVVTTRRKTRMVAEIEPTRPAACAAGTGQGATGTGHGGSAPQDRGATGTGQGEDAPQGAAEKGGEE